MQALQVTVDARLRFPAGLPRTLVAALKKITTHPNPDYHKKKAMGFSTWGGQGSIATWQLHDRGTPAESISLPRGVLAKVRVVCADAGYALKLLDRRTSLEPIDWPPLRFVPRYYQDAAIEQCMCLEQGIVRAPTGSGKTVTAFEFLHFARQPALVIMRDTNLLNQWRDQAVAMLGLHEKEIGVLKGGSALRVGTRLTLALQQTLHSESFPLDQIADLFGVVIVDECHGVAASTFQAVIGEFSARYRIGFSADETRKDKKEFLVYDQFGPPIYEISREALEKDGSITPVEVVLVPTDTHADWYRDAQSADRDFNRLLAELTADDDRNALIVRLVEHLSRQQAPSLVFSHRIEHARQLADVDLFAAGVRCGLLLGGVKEAVRFAEDKARLKSGALPVCTGTFAAVGQGIDMPAVRSGVMTTPIGKNRQFFGQVRGRICRPSEGKSLGRLYVIWDRHIFPDMPKHLASWNGGLTSIVELEDILAAA